MTSASAVLAALKQGLTLRTIAIMLVVDALICAAVIARVAYTEIDWIAYMQEVEGFLGGELDYVKLKGDTGPLVYPAGFVYLFSGLYYLTGQGVNIQLAQWVWATLHVLVTGTVLCIFRLAHVPTAAAGLLLFSRRIVSIFVLRCFNDCFAMAFAYAAVYAFMRNRWRLGSLLFSLGVSIKMNVLLMAPGLLTLYFLQSGGRLAPVVGHLTLCAIPQVLLGLPFLLHNWRSYLAKAFELNRVFTYEWTVNFRFLPESVFVSPQLGLLLLACTLGVWGRLYWTRWRHRSAANPSHVAMTMFESSFAGIVFSRTLHYQFYVWFFHQLPLLLTLSCDPAAVGAWWKLPAMVAIEVAFNVFPSTEWSSGILVATLLLTQYAILVSRDGRTVSPAPKTVAAASAARASIAAPNKD